MATRYWTAPDGPDGQQIELPQQGRGVARMLAQPISGTDIVYPPPGGGLLRVPPGGGAAAEMRGTAAGQLAFWKNSEGLWLPTTTAPSDGQMPQWDAAGETWRYVAQPSPASLQYLDLTDNPAGLWNFNRTLADASGNGNPMVVTGQYSYAQIVPGRYGLLFDLGIIIAQASAGTLLGITGDVTTEFIFQLDNNVPVGNAQVCSYSASGETQATNTLYQVTLGNYSNNPRVLNWLSEHGAGVNDAYDTPTAAGSESMSLIHNVIYLAARRRSNVIQFFLNGKASSPASPVLTAPDGGSSSKLYLFSTPTVTTQVGGILFSAKVTASALSDAAILASYNRSMGPAFGLLS